MLTFPPELKEAFRKLIESGKAVGDRPLVVGGFVRDWIAGQTIEEVHDFDIICEKGNILPLVNDLSQRFGLGAPARYDYTGTYKLLIDGFTFEFQDPQNPNVHFPIEDELMKMGVQPTFLSKNIYERDFTVDCLCYDMTNDRVLDLTGKGVEDLLKNKVVRTPIDPKKAIEFNPLIILRMVRMMIEFGLTPVPELEAQIPYGVTLLGDATQERSEKFVKKIVTETFNMNEEKAEELYGKYNLWGNVPMSKDLLDRKVKKDMGIMFQAMSVTVDPSANTMVFGITQDQMHHAKYRVAAQEAISDLYLNEKIDDKTRIQFLDKESCLVSQFKYVLEVFSDDLEYNIIKQSQRAYPGNPQNSFQLYERYQRRHEYRQRKRREQSRDRVGKIKSWRDFRTNFGGGR